LSCIASDLVTSEGASCDWKSVCVDWIVCNVGRVEPNAVSSCVGGGVCSVERASSVGSNREAIDGGVEALVVGASVDCASVVVVAISVGAALAVVGHDTSSSCCVTSVIFARRSSGWRSASVDGVACSRGVSV
jgi:hypothetical protein